MSAPERSSALDHALAYAGRGWAVLPCHQPRHGSCSCGRVDCSSPAKHPRTVHGLRDASTDQERIRAWWRRWPEANVAVRTGAASGLVVLDVDPPHGPASLAVLLAHHGALPPSLTVSTGSGGHHLYFAHPGPTLRNSAGVLGPGLDVRADGGYVLAPPSLHIAGRRYRWTEIELLASLPPWLSSTLRMPERRAAPALSVTSPRTDAQLSAWARQALTGELHQVRSAPVGSRNSELNRAAFALGQLVGGGHLDADLVHDLLTDAALASGLQPREVTATIHSGLTAGSQRPRHPADHRPLPAEPFSGHRRGTPGGIDLRTVELPAPSTAPPAVPARDLPTPPLP